MSAKPTPNTAPEQIVKDTLTDITRIPGIASGRGYGRKLVVTLEYAADGKPSRALFALDGNSPITSAELVLPDDWPERNRLPLQVAPGWLKARYHILFLNTLGRTRRKRVGRLETLRAFAEVAYQQFLTEQS